MTVRQGDNKPTTKPLNKYTYKCQHRQSSTIGGGTYTNKTNRRFFSRYSQNDCFRRIIIIRFFFTQKQVHFFSTPDEFQLDILYRQLSIIKNHLNVDIHMSFECVCHCDVVSLN